MSAKTAIRVGLGLVLSCAGTVFAQSETASFEKYRASYREKRAEIAKQERSELERLLSSYRTRVVAVRDRFQAAGDLEGVQGISAELKRIDEGQITIENVESHPVAQLETLQSLLSKSVRPIRLGRNEEERVLAEGYLRVLEELKVSLVKRGELDEAVAVNSEIEAASAELASLRAEPRGSEEPRPFPSALREGLVLRYSFDDEMEDKAINLASTRYKGTITGARKVEGAKFGLGLEFLTPLDQISIEGELPDMGRMTFSVWLENGGDTENGGIFSDFDGAAGRDVYLALIESAGVFVRADKDGAELKGVASFGGKWLRGWNHLVWVMGSQDTQIFLNGEKVGELSQAGSNNGNHGAVIGYAHDGSRYIGFRGIMDEICLWRRTLSEAEIEMLFEFAP